LGYVDRLMRRLLQQWQRADANEAGSDEAGSDEAGSDLLVSRQCSDMSSGCGRVTDARIGEPSSAVVHHITEQQTNQLTDGTPAVILTH